jgi:hypothetical protein
MSKEKRKKFYKYSTFYLLWVLHFYLVFTVYEATYNLTLWDQMTRGYFTLYGILTGSVATIFLKINDDFRIN